MYRVPDKFNIMTNTNEFLQEPPELQDPYSADALMPTYLHMVIPGKERANVEEDLKRFSKMAQNKLMELSLIAEKELPQLINFGPWGKRIDRFEMSTSWDELTNISAEEGLIAIGYEGASWARTYQFLKLYLFHPSSAFVSCPLAMTDGAAKVLKTLKPEKIYPDFFNHIISRDPNKFWVSGQWMTEKAGGSDVGPTGTIAKQVDGKWFLYGDKWFTSAATAHIAMTLARCEGDPAGSKGLSLFCVRLKDENGNHNKITYHRLKDKLGTRGMPTSELTLNGPQGFMVGERGQGVKNITIILNMTRIYNSVCAVATVARGLNILKDYANKRIVFGKLLKDQPLFLNTLHQVQARHEASFAFTFFVVNLLDKEEANNATDQERLLLRLLIPLLKLYTGKESVALTSEILEGFGGIGYLEDSGLPKLMRDAHVFPIWEGTTDVLSLDMLRVFNKSEAFATYMATVKLKLSQINANELQRAKDNLLSYISETENALKKLMAGPDLESHARELALVLSKIFAASVYLEFLQFGKQKGQRTVELAEVFVNFVCSTRYFR